MDKLIYSDETYEIKGAIFEVYKTLGAGFLEAVYHFAQVVVNLLGDDSLFH